MKFGTVIKSIFNGGRTLDGAPTFAVAQEPMQWFQKWTDGERKPINGAVAAAEGGIDAYAQSAALMSAYHYRMKDDGGKERIKTSALSRVLRNPNPYQTYSDFRVFLVRQLLATGNAYAVATRNDRNEVTALHPITFGSCAPIIEPETKEVFYSVRANELMAGEITFLIPARDVLHIKLYTPGHPLIGVSPLTYAAMAMSANSALSAHMATFFNNMARPSFLLTTDAQLTRDQMLQLRTAWQEQSKQMASGGVPILSNGLKAEQLGLTSQDAQLVEAFKMTVEDIGRALRIPLPLMGINTTYASTEALMGFWLSTGLGFLINHIEVAFDKFFDLPADEFVEFDTESLLRVDFAARVEGLAKATMSGLMSPNEGRARLELPAVENGDMPTLQQQQIPLNLLTELHRSQIDSKINPQPPEPPPAPTPPDDPDDGEDADLARSADPEITKALVISMMERKRKEKAA